MQDLASASGLIFAIVLGALLAELGIAVQMLLPLALTIAPLLVLLAIYEKVVGINLRDDDPSR